MRLPWPVWLPMLVLGLGWVWAGCRFDGRGLSRAPAVDLDVERPPGGDLRVDLRRTDQAVSDGLVEDVGSPGPDQAPTDALQPDQGPPSCPTTICKSCVAGVCEMDCTNGCTCPAGVNCQVSCLGSLCTSTIDCSAAASCAVDCQDDSCTNDILCPTAPGSACTVRCSDGSCRGSITCGPGKCTIECFGDSCTSEINCSSSCACSVECYDGSCSGNLTCPPGCEVDSGDNGCELVPASACKHCLLLRRPDRRGNASPNLETT